MPIIAKYVDKMVIYVLKKKKILKNNLTFFSLSVVVPAEKFEDH